MREFTKWEKVGIAIGIIATVGIGYLIYKKRKPKFDLIEGQNTIISPLNFKSAQDLITSINADGGSAVAVYMWDGAWYGFYDGDPASIDFEIKKGVEYLVKCTEPSIWTP